MASPMNVQCGVPVDDLDPVPEGVIPRNPTTTTTTTTVGPPKTTTTAAATTTASAKSSDDSWEFFKDMPTCEYSKCYAVIDGYFNIGNEKTFNKLYFQGFLYYQILWK